MDDLNQAHATYANGLATVVDSNILAGNDALERIEGADRRDIGDAVIDTEADEAYVLHTDREGWTQMLEGVESLDLRMLS